MLSFSLGITIIWRSTLSLTVLFKSCIFVVNMNLNKTILQSIYIIFRLFLLSLILNPSKNRTRFLIFVFQLHTKKPTKKVDIKLSKIRQSHQKLNERPAKGRFTLH